MAFTSIGYDGTVNERQWAELIPFVGAATYGVKGAGDLKVTAVPGQPLMVSVASGTGWGHGVMDTETSNTTIACDPIGSGSRWDLIALRRDWQPLAGGPTAVAKVTGTSEKVIPGSRQQQPGVVDDQPLALVQWTFGQTQPTQIIDLRCWAGNGGMVAVNDLVRSYLSAAGTRLYVDGIDWLRVVGANDLLQWTQIDAAMAVSPAASGTLARSDNTANINYGDTTLRVNIDANSVGPWTNHRGSGLECSVPGVYFISGRLLTDGPPGRYGTLYTIADRPDMVGSLTWTEDSPGAAYGGISFSGTFACPTGPAFWFTTTSYNTSCTIRPASRVSVTRVGRIG